GPDGSLACQAVMLDDLIDARDCILFVKIDAEGSEARVLAGMRRLLAENDCYLQVEIFPGFEGRLAGLLPDRFRKVAEFEWDHIFSSLPPDGVPGETCGEGATNPSAISDSRHASTSPEGIAGR